MAKPGKIAVAADGRYELEITRRFEKPIEEVWDAITRPERIAHWLGEVKFEPRAGSPITIDFGGSESVTGKILEFSPPHVFAYTWSEVGKGADDSVVHFELREDAGETRLVLTHSKQSATMAQGTAGGWHAQVDLLDGYLSGKPLEWDDVYPAAKALYASVVKDIR